MKLVYKIGIGISVATNIFFISIGAYSMLTTESRVKENREWLKSVIVEEVYKQVKESMPNESGGVNVGNK